MCCRTLAPSREGGSSSDAPRCRVIVWAMRARLLTSILALAFVSGFANSQNLLKNGDFEASSTSYAPWKLTDSKASKNPGIDTAVKVGLDDNNAFRVTTVSNVPAGITQDFVIKQQGIYQIGVHMRTNWPTRVRIRIMTGNRKTMEHLLNPVAGPSLLISHGFHLTEETHRLEVVALGSHGKDVTTWMDDVFVHAAPKVQLQVIDLVPYSILIRSFNVPEPVALFAAVHRAPKPFAVPGWNGLFALDPIRSPGVILLNARVGLSEAINKQLLARVGRTIHLQGIGLKTRSFSPAVSFRVR